MLHNASAGFIGGVIPTDPYYYTDLLILHGEGTDGGTTFTDNAKGYTLSANAGVTTSTTQFQFGTSSLNFTGAATVAMSTPSSTAFAFGNGTTANNDFSIEFWMYPTTQSGATPLVIGNYNSTGGAVASTWFLEYNRTATPAAAPNTLGFWMFGVQSTGPVIQTPAIILPNSGWYFIQLSRSGTTYSLAIGGVVVGTFTTTVSLDGGTAQAMYFGGMKVGVSGVNYAGYLDEIRVSRMNRLQSPTTGTNFTPPTASFPDSFALGDQLFAAVDGLYHYEGVLTDSSATLGTMTLTAPTALSTTQAKFGTGSIVVATTAAGGSMLGASSPTALILGAGDWTIECWAYPTFSRSGGFSQTLFDTCTSSISDSLGVTLTWDTSPASVEIVLANAVAASSTAIPISSMVNQWNHVVFQRHSGVLQVFVNGVLYVSLANTTNFNAAKKFTVGSLNFGTGLSDNRPWIGYIDEVRVSVGVARYPGFPIQSVAYQDLSLS